MAKITITDINVLDQLEGSAFYTTRSSTVLSLVYSQTGVTLQITGSGFLYSGGEPFAGTINGISYLKNGAGVVITGYNFTVGQFLSAAQDEAALLNLLWGGADEILGSAGSEWLYSHGGNDTIIALDGDDEVYGGVGDDDVNGNVGRDIVHGDDGADFVRGGRDNDTIYGDAGNDVHVNGNIGNDLVYGGVGNDTVYGGQDQDTLHGDAGNDLLSGDLGNDILYGELGADQFAQRLGGGFDWVGDFNAGEGDRILLATGTAYTVVTVSGQPVIQLADGSQLGLANIAASSFSAGWIVFG